MATLQLSIYRYDPERDKKPYMQDFEFAKESSDDMMLLDLLLALQEKEPSLAFRKSCGEGVCGSNGMNINGKNGLACITPVASLGNKITVRPLPGLPVIKDLVVDLTQFYEQYKKAKPYLINNEPVPAKERLQTPAERAKLDGLYECILCACCTTSCPSWWWNPEKFIGPAGLLAAYRFLIDSRDTATTDRLANLDDAYSVFRCRGIMNCTSVCPKGLNPAAAIGKIRLQLVSNLS